MKTLTIETLRQLPAFSGLFADAERESLTKRQAEIAAWHDANAAARREIAELEAIERKATEAHDKLAAELNAATEQRDLARVELLRLANKHHHAREASKQRIAAGADSRLLDFIGWTRHASNLAAFASHRSELQGFGKGNNRQHLAAMQARKVGSLCDSAAERAEQMRLEAISDADMTDELAAMAGAIRQSFEPLAQFAPSGLSAEFPLN